jgi:endonuclease/exonuclease/phosphatase family metal-dependent hydrolase
MCGSYLARYFRLVLSSHRVSGNILMMLRNWLTAISPMRHERAPMALLLLVALSTIAMLQAIRVFVPYMIFDIDQSRRAEIAVVTAIVFLLIGLGGVGFQFLGERLLIISSVAILLTGRIVLQLWSEPTARWVLGAVAVVGWGWLMIALIPRDRSVVALGLGFAFVVDLMIRGARVTADLPWMPGALQHLVSLALAAGVVASAVTLLNHWWIEHDEPGLLESLPLVGAGSGVALFLLVSGNPGFAQETSETDLGGALWLLGSGGAVALLFTIAPPEIARRPRTGKLSPAIAPIFGAVAALSVFLWDTQPRSWLIDVTVPLFVLTTTYLTMLSVRGTGVRDRAGRWMTAICFTLGMLLQAAFIFIYFSSSGQLLVLLAPIALLTASAMVSGQSAEAIPVGSRVVALPTIASLTLIIGVWLWIDVTASTPAGHASGADTLTVMTYNIQEGFPADRRWSLEETANAIESFDADVVMLQETTRGWLSMTSIDQIEWLSQRLDMPYVFAGASHDGMWGNAVLSRLPILGTESLVYSETVNLRRGAVAAEIEANEGNIWMVSTHLDNPARADAVRLSQTEELLGFVDDWSQVIIGGDFNADPDSDVVNAVLSAGYQDPIATFEPDATTSESGRRIDYLFVSDGLTVEAANVPDVAASDHRPVLATIALDSPDS